MRARGKRDQTSATAPEHLPVLSTGRHSRPEDGACVMEYVSVLSGGRFTDRPRCTHPALAALARMVNDRIDDPAVRNQLARLAPELIEVGGRDIKGTPLVVRCCLRAAESLRQLRPSERHRLDRAGAALHRLDRSPGARAAERCRRVINDPELAVASAIRLAWDHTQGLPRAQRDRWLHDLLTTAISECRQLLEPRPSVPGADCGSTRHRLVPERSGSRPGE